MSRPESNTSLAYTSPTSMMGKDSYLICSLLLHLRILSLQGKVQHVQQKKRGRRMKENKNWLFQTQNAGGGKAGSSGGEGKEASQTQSHGGGGSPSKPFLRTFFLGYSRQTAQSKSLGWRGKVDGGARKRWGADTRASQDEISIKS